MNLVFNFVIDLHLACTCYSSGKIYLTPLARDLVYTIVGRYVTHDLFSKACMICVMFVFVVVVYTST